MMCEKELQLECGTQKMLLINVHKHMMCCEETATGVWHPEDAVNKDQNT